MPSRSGALARADVRRRVRTIAGGAVIALAVAACMPRARPAPHVLVDETWVYTCAGNYQFAARLMNEVVAIRLPGRTTAIPRAGRSTGTRYATRGAELVRRGETATLRIDGATHSDCAGERAATPWDEARLLGADCRAIGHETAWSLEVDEGKQIRVLSEGSSEIHAPVPEPVRNGTTTSYRAVSEGHTIDVTIEARPCTIAALEQG